MSAGGTGEDGNPNIIFTPQPQQQAKLGTINDDVYMDIYEMFIEQREFYYSNTLQKKLKTLYLDRRGKSTNMDEVKEEVINEFIIYLSMSPEERIASEKKIEPIEIEMTKIGQTEDQEQQPDIDQDMVSEGSSQLTMKKANSSGSHQVTDHQTCQLEEDIAEVKMSSPFLSKVKSQAVPEDSFAFKGQLNDEDKKFFQSLKQKAQTIKEETMSYKSSSFKPLKQFSKDDIMASQRLESVKSAISQLQAQKSSGDPTFALKEQHVQKVFEILVKEFTLIDQETLKELIRAFINEEGNNIDKIRSEIEGCAAELIIDELGDAEEPIESSPSKDSQADQLLDQLPQSNFKLYNKMLNKKLESVIETVLFLQEMNLRTSEFSNVINPYLKECSSEDIAIIMLGEAVEDLAKKYSRETLEKLVSEIRASQDHKNTIGVKLRCLSKLQPVDLPQILTPEQASEIKYVYGSDENLESLKTEFQLGKDESFLQYELWYINSFWKTFLEQRLDLMQFKFIKYNQMRQQVVYTYNYSQLKRFGQELQSKIADYNKQTEEPQQTTLGMTSQPLQTPKDTNPSLQKKNTKVIDEAVKKTNQQMFKKQQEEESMQHEDDQFKSPKKQYNIWDKQREQGAGEEDSYDIEDEEEIDTSTQKMNGGGFDPYKIGTRNKNTLENQKLLDTLQQAISKLKRGEELNKEENRLYHDLFKLAKEQKKPQQPEIEDVDRFEEEEKEPPKPVKQPLNRDLIDAYQKTQEVQQRKEKTWNEIIDDFTQLEEARRIQSDISLDHRGNQITYTDQQLEDKLKSHIMTVQNQVNYGYITPNAGDWKNHVLRVKLCQFSVKRAINVVLSQKKECRIQDNILFILIKKGEYNKYTY